MLSNEYSKMELQLEFETLSVLVFASKENSSSSAIIETNNNTWDSEAYFQGSEIELHPGIFHFYWWICEEFRIQINMNLNAD